MTPGARRGLLERRPPSLDAEEGVCLGALSKPLSESVLVTVRQILERILITGDDVRGVLTKQAIKGEYDGVLDPLGDL